MKSRWHIWVVGSVPCFRNASGAFESTMTTRRNAAYMRNFTPDQLAYLYNFPQWIVASWAIAVWCTLLGSVLSDAAITGLVGNGVFLFSLALVTVGILTMLYGRRVRQNRVLR